MFIELINSLIILNDGIQIINYAVRNSDELHTSSYYVAEGLRSVVDKYKSGELGEQFSSFFRNKKA